MVFQLEGHNKRENGQKKVIRIDPKKKCQEKMDYFGLVASYLLLSHKQKEGRSTIPAGKGNTKYLPF